MARWIRRLAVPIIVGWIALIAVLTVTVPQLEVVGQMRSVSMSPKEAPSVAAMMRVGKVFEEFDSDSSAMIVLEGDRPLGADAHSFYDDMIAKLRADSRHVQHIQDFWGDPLTRAGAQSEDGLAAYVQVYLAGNMGETLGNESVAAVKHIVAGLSPPPGVKVFVTGGPALQADQQEAGDASVRIIELVTVGVIILMLLFFYRSIVTVLLVLTMLVLGLLVTRGVVAFLGYHDLIGLSTFATQLLVTLAIAATTDYAIFLIGRYQEARTVGEDRESAYYTMFRGTAHVVLGSGMTIAGATFCLSFTRLPYFPDAGHPARGRNGRRSAWSADSGARDNHRREPLRTLRAQARHADSLLAALRRRRRPMAGLDLAHDDHSRLGRPAYAAGLPAELQRPKVPTGRPAGKRGIRRGRTTFPRLPDESRTAARRNRSGPAQFGGLPGDRADHQGRDQGARHRKGAVDHPPRR
jgi:hypothetical protein